MPMLTSTSTGSGPSLSTSTASLAEHGSLVIDIGGAWNKGLPTRSLYHFKLLIMLVEEYGFHLAQEFYWWNPSKLPSPAEWVTVRRIRAKDAINTVWWLSKTEWPKASNRRVLQPYSSSMRSLLKNGYRAKLRPSGHDISEKFSRNNGAAIPPTCSPSPTPRATATICATATSRALSLTRLAIPATSPSSSSACSLTAATWSSTPSAAAALLVR